MNEKKTFAGMVAVSLLAVAHVAYASSGLISLTNDLSVLSFDWRGSVASLRERETGRELIEKGAFAFFNTPAKCLYPTGFSALGDDRYRWQFKEGGVLTARIWSFGPGWSFEIEEASATNAMSLFFGWLKPVPQKWKGGILNMVSDEESGYGKHVATRRSEWITPPTAFVTNIIPS